MQWITVATPPFNDVETFDAVASRTSGDPQGMEARYVGATAEGKLRIVTLWESREHADRFFSETLGPALAKVLGPEPVGPSEVTGIGVERAFVRQPVS